MPVALIVASMVLVFLPNVSLGIVSLHTVGVVGMLVGLGGFNLALFLLTHDSSGVRDREGSRQA